MVRILEKVDEMSNLGPILEDTKISIEIKQGDSVLKSDEIKVGERSELYIDLDNKLYEYEVKITNKQIKVRKIQLVLMMIIVIYIIVLKT